MTASRKPTLMTSIDGMQRLLDRLGLNADLGNCQTGTRQTQPSDPYTDTHRRQDLCWIQSLLTNDNQQKDSLTGNYVAVRHKSIIAIAQTLPQVKSNAACELGITSPANIEDHCIIVPVSVRDQDSQDQWQNLQLTCKCV